MTGRSKIVKMEGGYHGGHDAVSVSVKPKENQFGDPENPTPVVSGQGVLKGTSDATLVAPFNNLAGYRAIVRRSIRVRLPA